MTSAPRRITGFTLLEILVTLLIMSLLITTAVQAFQSIHRAEERALSSVGRARTAQVLLDRIERELAGAVLVPRPQTLEPSPQPWVFVAEDRAHGDQGADALRFVTLGATRAPEVERGGPRVIAYELREAALDRFPARGETALDGAALELVRREDALGEPEQPLADVLAQLDGQLVADAVADFRLRYQDESSEEWRDAWDSRSEAMLDALPLAVEVTIALWEGTREGARIRGESHTRVVRLPLRPDTFARPAAGLDDDCGKTVGVCWREHVAPALEPASGVGRRLQSLYEAVPPASCWNATDPDVASLRGAVRELDAELARECE